jgi:hypothetical protein
LFSYSGGFCTNWYLRTPVLESRIRSLIQKKKINNINIYIKFKVANHRVKNRIFNRLPNINVIQTAAKVSNRLLAAKISIELTQIIAEFWQTLL